MEYIKLPSVLKGFTNTNTKIVETKSNKLMYLIDGIFRNDEESYICPNCNNKLHINNKYEVNLSIRSKLMNNLASIYNRATEKVCS